MADYVDRGLNRIGITISKPILAIVCIIFGTMVILFPNLLVWIVGLFLMVQGTLLLVDSAGQESNMLVSKSVYCYHCGTKNIEEAIYCKKCGKKVEQVLEKKSRSEPKRMQKNRKE